MDTSQVSEAVRELSTVQDFVRWGVTLFNQADLVYGHGTDNAWDESVFLVLGSLHLPMDVDKNVLGAKLTERERLLVSENISRRVSLHIPVPYLVKEAWFGGLSFYVDERVIIPRSPIAELIEEEFRPWVEPSLVGRILDLCTGSGCIGISAAYTFEDATVDLVDISDEALAVAKRNVERLGVEDTVQLFKSDLFDNLPAAKYDIIVSNPPYVGREELSELPPEYHHEPILALKAGEDGLVFVRRILKEASRFLTPKGVLVVEVGFSQEALEAAFPTVPFTWLQFSCGGDGVFLLTYDELLEYQDFFQ